MSNLVKMLPLTWLACQILLADPLDFNTQFEILKQVRLHAPLPFQALLVQDRHTKIQQVFLADLKSPLKVQLSEGFILPNKEDSARLKQMRRLAIKHNFFTKHSKDFKTLIKTLPYNNVITLEPLSEHASKEFVLIVKGGLNEKLVSKLADRLKNARVYLVLLGAFADEEEQDDSFDAAAYLKGLHITASTLKKLALLKLGLQNVRVNPLKEPFLDRIQENVGVASELGLLEGIGPYLPFFYEIH
ncbi:hypothetical protein NHP190002_01040 [Helicobacter ailurogastricus]|uniref:hypothetical protein n=1 Tax=Helicobacter ailurogastricus TaxID=1578720 RepID=UPI00244D8C99|nr:hypothetical protein [Helicobacter ailurogastricus]GMB89427.1 hypothetical protein NHP190002_01040 [Helicobacter ailurogastricus]